LIIGHEKITSFLASSIEHNRLAHAYLFIGPDGVGKKKVALEFIKRLQCEKNEIKSKEINACGRCRNCLLIEQGAHPDILTVAARSKEIDAEEPAKKTIKVQEIKIEQIRQIQHQISLFPYFRGYKAVIIERAEQMTQEAANCLLKTLEEPPEKSLLILICSASEKLLSTIVSRCQLVKFLPVKQDLISQAILALGLGDKNKIAQAVKFSCGRPGVAISLLEQPLAWEKQDKSISELKVLIKKDLVEKFKYAQKLSQNAPEAQEILGQWLIRLRDELLFRLGLKEMTVFGDKNLSDYSFERISEIIKNISQARHMLGDSSFNSRLILDNLMLKL
jgi:DNA polymerase-3 subunit delta'